MARVAMTSVALLGMFFIKLPSIFNLLSLNLDKYFIEEYPVPKSSRAIETPKALNCLSCTMDCLASFIRVFSVNSNSRYCGSKLLSASELEMVAAKSVIPNCITDILIDITNPGYPIFCQVLFCKQA